MFNKRTNKKMKRIYLFYTRVSLEAQWGYMRVGKFLDLIEQTRNKMIILKPFFRGERRIKRFSAKYQMEGLRMIECPS